MAYFFVLRILLALKERNFKELGSFCLPSEELEDAEELDEDEQRE